MRGWLAAISSVLLPLAAPVAPLAAQDAEPPPTTTSEEALAAAARVYGPQEPKRCDPESTDDSVIIVCRELEDQEQFRVRSDEEAENDYARRTMNRDSPHVPSDLIDGDGIFKGPATVSGVCGIGLNPCPPPPALIIDLAAIPEAPEGSDAELIGKGEKAR